jgi:hypothetical protein
MTVSVEVADVYVAVEPTGRPVQVTDGYEFIVDPWKKRNVVVPDGGETLNETERPPLVNDAVAVEAPVVFKARSVPALIIVEPV